MHARILNKTPISGSGKEKYFGTIALTNLWIEFEDSRFEKWYGSFARSNPHGLDDLIFDEKYQAAFVSAGGLGYLVDIDMKELIVETEDNQPIYSVMKSHEPNYLIYTNQSEIIIYEGLNLIKTINLGRVDGIWITDIKDKKVLGDLWEVNSEDFNVGFELDLTTLILTIDKSRLIDRWGVKEQKKKEKKIKIIDWINKKMKKAST